MKIAVVAPSSGLNDQIAERLQEIVCQRGDCDLVIHPQCFLSAGHFAGPDEARLAALRDMMADPSIDAVWFARGGYGSNRIAAAAAQSVPDEARRKRFMGYSDAGFLHAAFHKAGLEVAWGPMPQDLVRERGDAAIQRALDWFVERDPSALEPGIEQPAMAFNLTVLNSLLGTPLEPDLSGVDLMIEEVSEHLYHIDRMMFHLTASPNVRNVSRMRLGRVSDVPENDRNFGSDEVAIVEDWCSRAGIAFGGPADIGHDAQNKIVPFGSQIR
jgi:muramoyltetrapeptide carboxypeptidase